MWYGDPPEHDPSQNALPVGQVEQGRVLDLLGEGPIKGLVNGLKSVYLNETVLQNADNSFNFTGLSLAMVKGTESQAVIPGFEGTESPTSVTTEATYITSVSRTVSNTSATHVRVKASFPALFDSTSGTAHSTSVTVAVDITPTVGAPYTPTLQGGGVVTAYSTTKLVVGFNLALNGTGPWTVTLRRVTADSATPLTLANRSYFESFDTIVDGKFQYPNSALAALVVPASQFASVPSRAYDCYLKMIKIPSNYNPTTRVYTGVWDGTFVIDWTDNPAWIFYDMATAKRYGAGEFIDASKLDKWALYTIAQFCDELVDNGAGGTEPRFTCNCFIQTTEQAIKVLGYFASVFRASLYWAGNTIVPVQDADHVPVGILSNSNVVNGKFEYSGTAKKARHTQCIVYWNDPAQAYKRVPYLVQDDAGVARYGLNSVEVTAFGGTSMGQAKRHGLFTLASELTQTETVSCTSGLEGTTLRPGYIFYVSDAFRGGSRMGGRIKTATSTAVTLDAPVTLLAGKTYTLACKLPDGTVEARPVTTGSGTVSTLAVSAAYSVAPQALSQWLLATTDAPATKYRAVSIKEAKGGASYDIVGLIHNPDKYAAIETGLTV